MKVHLIAPTTTSVVVNGAAYASSLQRGGRTRQWFPSPVVTNDKTRLQTSASTISGQSVVAESEPQHLVLIGGGHAHVQVIKALNRGARPPHLHVTLIDAVAAASYSGMVPGCIAGYYTPEETQLRLSPLAEWADIRFIHDTVLDIDFQEKSIYLKGAPMIPISFDAVSIDIGSTSRGYTTCPGALQYAIPTRPIDQLIYRLESAAQVRPLTTSLGENSVADESMPRRLVVVGGGIAGIELSMVIVGRWEREGIPFDECIILDANPNGLLPNESDASREVVQQILEEKKIQVRYGCIVEKIEKSHVVVAQSSIGGVTMEVPYTHCIWSTGAGAHSLSWHLSKARGLQCDDNGWICVSPTLQSISYPFVFAAGDCATIQDPLRPSPPKAGVYAVRSGPILIENLTRYLESIRRDWSGELSCADCMPSSDLTLQPYVPQNDFLKLLVCGDGTALGFRFGIVFRGKWVFQLKDSIDQQFMKLFDVSGIPKPEPNNVNCSNGKYDTQQYDNTLVQKAFPTPDEAALLLQRTDDDVDFEDARGILSRMGTDSSYRDAVLLQIHQSGLSLPVIIR
jgi:selenide, water dikinase